MVEQPLLSIIVTSYTTDRLKDIYELLDSIKSQNYQYIEIIFVAERSRELEAQVRNYAEQAGINNFRAIINETQLGISPSRNLGAKEAEGDIVAFVDDDVVLCPCWVEEIVKTYRDDRVIGVTGPALPLWYGESKPWFPKELYWIISCTAWCDWNEVTEVRNAWGHGMSFRREAFQYCQFTDTFGRTEGAHEAGKRGPVGDDTEFCINLRNKSQKAILFNPKAELYHKVYPYRLASRFIRRQAYWQGYTKGMFKKLYDGDGKNRDVLETEHELLRRILLGLLPRTIGKFFTHPIFAWKRLSLTLSVLFHITVGYFSAAFPSLGKFIRRAYGFSQ